MADKMSSGGAVASHGSSLGNFFQRFQGLQSHRNAMDDLIKDLLIHCNQVESDLREESKRLVSAHLDLANAVNAGRELQQVVEFYQEQEERTQERTVKEIEKIKVFQASTPDITSFFTSSHRGWRTDGMLHC